MIRRLRWAGMAAVVVVVGVVAGLGVRPAVALAPDAQGWWWVGEPGGPVAVPPPPWVPPDGLYVASNPQGTEAFSAVHFTLPPGTTASGLTFEVAEARGTASVGLCATSTSWEPAQGGPMGHAPGYDCDAGAAVGVLDEEQTTVTFAVSTLGGRETIDVAIVPTEDETGSIPTFQLALAKPNEGALSVTQTSSGGSGVSGAASTDATIGVASGFTGNEPADEVRPLPTAPAPAVGGSPLPPSPPPSGSRAQVGGASGASSAPSSSPIAPAASVPGDDSDGSRHMKVIGYLVVVAAAYTYHRLSRVPDRAPNSLISFGGSRPEDGASSPPAEGAGA